MSLRHCATALVVLGVTCLLPLGAFAQSDEAYVEYRQKVMGGIGGNMGAIGAILKQKLPMTGNIEAHADAINAGSRAIKAAFDKEVTAGETDAKANIWSDHRDFLSKAEAMATESAKLMEVAKSGDMGAIGDQVKALGKSCGGCHKEYRKPKEESYKKKM